MPKLIILNLPDNQERLITVIDYLYLKAKSCSQKDAAIYLGLSKFTLRNRTQQGLQPLPRCKSQCPGGYEYRYYKEDLDNYMKEQQK